MTRFYAILCQEREKYTRMLEYLLNLFARVLSLGGCAGLWVLNIKKSGLMPLTISRNIKKYFCTWM